MVHVWYMYIGCYFNLLQNFGYARKINSAILDDQKNMTSKNDFGSIKISLLSLIGVEASAADFLHSIESVGGSGVAGSCSWVWQLGVGCEFTI